MHSIHELAQQSESTIMFVRILKQSQYCFALCKSTLL